MKVKTLSALAGIGTAMILSGQAQADFVGVAIVNENAFFASHPNANVQAAWNATGGSLDVYRVYAYFDSLTSNDRVNTLFGDPTRPFSLTSTSGTFFNVTDSYGNHNNVSVAASNFGGNGQYGFDTYVGPAYPVNAGSNIITGPGSFDAGQANNLTGNFAATNFATTIEPGNAAGLASTIPAGNSTSALPPGVAGRVFLMQLTVPAGTDITGTAGLAIGGTSLAAIEEVFVTFTTIPAPGALALLGLAGLVGARRRRS